MTVKVAIAVLALGLAGAAYAQDYKPPAKRVAPTDGLVAQVKPVGETPKMANGKPDFTAQWGPGPADAPYAEFGSRGLEFFEPDQAAFQRASHWNRPIYKPEHWEKVYNLDYGRVEGDPAFHCQPRGVPRLHMPGKIVMTPTQMVTQNGGVTRYIPLDGRKRDEGDSDYELYNGWGLGHWEDDVLVVESTGFNDLTWLSWHGYFHSNRMTVTERFWRKGDVLYYRFVVNDPEVLAQPWESETFLRRANRNPLARVEETAPCKEMDAKELFDPYYRG